MVTMKIQLWDKARKIAALALVLSFSFAMTSRAGGPPPIIAVQPLGVSVPLLGTATFTVVAISGTTLSYRWLKNGNNVPGNNNGSSLILRAVNAGDAGDYTVEVKNAGGTVVSAVATLTLLADTATITSQPQNQALAVGQTAAFAVAASSTATRSYQWKFNGAVLVGATNATLTLTDVHASNAGSYTVDVSVPGNTITSQAASLVVTNPVVNLVTSGSAGIGMTPSGFAFQMSVPVGSTYVVEAASDANNWVPIATNISATASVVFLDSAAANYSARFYRVLVR